MSLDAFDYVENSFTASSDTNHSDIHNGGYDQLLVLINVTSITNAGGGSLEFKVQGKDPISGTYYDLITTGDVSGQSPAFLEKLEVAPPLTESANEKVSNVLPEHFRVKVLVGTDDVTYTIHVEMS